MADEKDEREIPEGKQTLTAITEQAAKDLADKEKENEKEPEKTKEDEESREESTEEEEPEEKDALSTEELGQAKYIYKLLKDPKTALPALDTLAKSAGFSLNKFSVEEKKEVAKSIKDRVKDSLGTKIPFLSEELGELLQSLLTDVIEERTKDIREEVRAETAARRSAEMKTVFETVVSGYENISDELLKEVVKIQENEYIVPGKASPEMYFKACLNMAAESLGVSLIKKSGTSQQRTVATKEKSPLAMLKNSRTAGSREGLKTTQIKTMNDAINAAAEMVDAKFAEK